jgi:hypothetical protein
VVLAKLADVAWLPETYMNCVVPAVLNTVAFVGAAENAVKVPNAPIALRPVIAAVEYCGSSCVEVPRL